MYGGGICGYVFGDVPKLVEDHNRLRSIRLCLKFLGKNGYILSPSMREKVLAVLEVLFKTGEEVVIPSYPSPSPPSISPPTKDIVKIKIRPGGEKPRPVSKIHARRKYFAWQRSRQDKLGNKKQTYPAGGSSSRTQGSTYSSSATLNNLDESKFDDLLSKISKGGL